MADDATTTVDEKESLARAHLPYRAEYCKTGRAKCKKCQESMEANSLKLANMTKSRFHDGYDASFYHVKCFFQIKRPATVAEIRHFETLKYEDQKMLEKAVETKGLSVLGTDVAELDQNGNNKVAKVKGSKKAKKRDNTEVEASDGFLINYNDFLVEYAKSNRAKCNLCEEKIEKDEIRLGKLDYEAETPWRGGPVPRWFHLECFIKSQQQLEFFGQIEKIQDFDKLEKEDQRMLKKKIKPVKPEKTSGGDVETKKIKTEDLAASLKEKEEEKLLKKQSDRYFKLREFINTMKRKDIERMLEYMRQKSNFKSPSMLIDMATDVLLFGPLNGCPLCKNDACIILRGSSYICTSGTEWEPCSYETREPSRGMPDVPEEVVEKYPFFQDTYKFRIRKRIFPSKFVKAVEQKEAEDNKIVQDGAPLDGLTIGVISWKGVQTEKTKVQNKITTLGGKIQTALDKSIFVILSSEQELSNEASPKVEVAKALDIPFVTADFLFKVETKDDVVPQLKKCLIGEWKGDLQERFTKLDVNQLKTKIKSRSAANVAKSVYKSGSVAKSRTLIVKDGTAVDPESGYDEVGRVYKRGPHVYSVVLNCVDVAKDKNSFYKLQIIQHETKKSCFLFRSWGRIGCEVGGNTLNNMDGIDTAIAEFERHFKERTGNEFSSVADGTFKKKHGLYFPVELDYSDGKKQEEEFQLECTSQSKLEPAIQELICFILDVQRMQRAMLQFELDAEKMPLGKLSKKHILEAMQILRDLESVLEVKPPKKPSKRRLVGLTNQFYSLIPQSFGDGQVKLIDSFKEIEEKNQMLAGLSEIEIAYSMCATIDKSSDQLPIDQHYIKLNCDISVLNQEDYDFQVISDYVKQTHALTHNNYTLIVQDIFKVRREEDVRRFAEHKMKERALLWHGSRSTNMAGIMSQGLRIAPSEAPQTGYMFGKGIYFADMVSKAANYCMTDPTNDVGLLLLCEVALGKMYELFKSDAELPGNMPEGYDSVYGVGKSVTNPKTHVRMDDNLLVPIGKQTANKGVKSQLLYNEYIVYNESQVMIRYIVKTKFDFKS